MAKFALSLIVLFSLLGVFYYFGHSNVLFENQHNGARSCHPRCRPRVPNSPSEKLYGAHGQRLSPVVATRDLDTDDLISYDAVAVVTGYDQKLPVHSARLDEVVGCYAGFPLKKGEIIGQYSIYPLPEDVESSLVCTERSIRKGAIIGSGDVSSSKTTAEPAAGMLSQCSQAIGRQALKDLPLGSFLKKDDVTAKP